MVSTAEFGSVFIVLFISFCSVANISRWLTSLFSLFNCLCYHYNSWRGFVFSGVAHTIHSLKRNNMLRSGILYSSSVCEHSRLGDLSQVSFSISGDRYLCFKSLTLQTEEDFFHSFKYGLRECIDDTLIWITQRGRVLIEKHSVLFGMLIF